jgi:hypothetical protein
MLEEWRKTYEELTSKMAEDDKTSSKDDPYPRYAHSEAWWEMYNTLEIGLALVIEKAFANMQYPGDDNLVWSSHDAFVDFYETFRGKHWKNISENTLYSWRHDLHRFTPEAFRYYLPAFIISELRSTEGADLEAVIFYLTPPEEEGPKTEFFQSRIEGFTPHQKEVLTALVTLYTGIESTNTNNHRRAIDFWEKI